MQLVQSASLGNISNSDLLRFAASVEAATRHPLADSVARAAKQQGISVPVSSDANTEPGSGVHAVVEGREVLNRPLLLCSQPAFPSDLNYNSWFGCHGIKI